MAHERMQLLSSRFRLRGDHRRDQVFKGATDERFVDDSLRARDRLLRGELCELRSLDLRE